MLAWKDEELTAAAIAQRGSLTMQTDEGQVQRTDWQKRQCREKRANAEIASKEGVNQTKRVQVDEKEIKTWSEAAHNPSSIKPSKQINSVFWRSSQSKQNIVSSIVANLIINRKILYSIQIRI